MLRSVLFLVFFSSSLLFSQSKFPFFVYAESSPINYSTYQKIKQIGFNGVVSLYNDDIKRYCDSLGLLMAPLTTNQGEITYSTSSYYSPWKVANEIKQPLNSLGFGFTYPPDKALIDNGILIGNSATAPYTLLNGPHYLQDKLNKIYWQVVPYSAQFNISWLDPGNVPDSEVVCTLKVVLVYRFIRKYKEVTKIDEIRDEILGSLIVKKENFGDLNFEFTIPYRYDTVLFYKNSSHTAPNYGGYTQVDNDGYTDFYIFDESDFAYPPGNPTYHNLGVDYRIIFNGKGNLLVDSIIVSDDKWATIKEQDITSFANENNRPNIKFWYGLDEPNSLDTHYPQRKISEWLTNTHEPKNLISAFYPSYNGTRSHDNTVQRFNKIANPTQILTDLYPYWPNVTNRDGLKFLTNNLHEITLTNKPLFLVAQGFGGCQWRKPTWDELNASIMLGLSYGSKGIFIWPFSSYNSWDENCGDVYYDCLVDENLNDTPLSLGIRDNLAPRLNGKLGETLLTLDYKSRLIDTLSSLFDHQLGNFKIILDEYITKRNMHFSLLKNSNQNYLFITNLLCDINDPIIDEVYLIISRIPEWDGYKNITFRNIESTDYNSFSTPTFSKNITINKKADGWLYEASPSVIAGGDILVNDSTGSNDTLKGYLKVKSGTTLKIKNNYLVKAPLMVESGGTLLIDGNANLKLDNTIIEILNGGNLVVNPGANIDLIGTSEIIVKGNANSSGIANKRISYTGEGNTIFKVTEDGSLQLRYSNLQGGLKGVYVPSKFEANLVYIDDCNFADFEEAAIFINRETPNYLIISDVNIEGPDNPNSMGIYINGGYNVVIRNSNIINTSMGIFLNWVNEAVIIDNIITSDRFENNGIQLNYTNGRITGNEITGFLNGIELGNSSPILGGNTIYSNLLHGLYVGSGSIPDLSTQIVNNECNGVPTYYTIGGLNTFYDNGNSIASDGSEIVLDGGEIILNNGEGCNTLIDDRGGDENLILISNPNYYGELYAELQNWGQTEISQERFSGFDYVYYEPTSTCEPPLGSENCPIVIVEEEQTIDTVYALGPINNTVTQEELEIAEAEYQYISNNYESAENKFLNIINSYNLSRYNLKAYEKLLLINSKNEDSTKISQLREIYQNKLSSNIEDTLIRKSLKHLLSMAEVKLTEYIPAINKFTEVIENNPNTREAVYAEIDILNTSLLIDVGDSTLRKTLSSKYSVKNDKEYTEKLYNLLGLNLTKSNNTKSVKKLVPTEYLLYQNYPNPFNPETTIKFDLPKQSMVEMKLFDILGQEISLLINEEKPAGKYELKINMNDFPSGIYFYQIKAGNYSSVKKMMLLK